MKSAYDSSALKNTNSQNRNLKLASQKQKKFNAPNYNHDEAYLYSLFNDNQDFHTKMIKDLENMDVYGTLAQTRQKQEKSKAIIVKNIKIAENYQEIKRVQSASSFQNTKFRIQSASQKKLTILATKKQHTEQGLYKKELKILSQKLHLKLKIQLAAKTQWVRLIIFYRVLEAIKEMKVKRTLQIISLEETARTICDEQDLCTVIDILRIPRSNYTLYMEKFAEKMSGRFLNKYLLSIHKHITQVNKFRKMKFKVINWIRKIRNHCQKKKEAVERLSMVFYEEFENLKSWQGSISLDQWPAVEFKISNNMEIYKKEIVNEVIGRYVDYEFVQFLIKRVTVKPVSNLISG